MILKKGVAAGLCMAMIAGLSACGGDTSTETTADNTAVSGTETAAAASTSETTSSEESASSEDTQSGTETSEQTTAQINVTWDDMANLNVVYMAASAIPSGLQEVEDAINEITEPQINAHINLQMIEMGSYAQQISLMMSSSEQVDLLMTFPGGAGTFAVMQQQGQIMDITDLLSEYGQPVLDTVGNIIRTTTVNGRIYGVPSYRMYAGSLYLLMRTDVLDDLGLTEQAQNIETMKDLEVILEAVHSSEKWADLACLAPSSGDGNVAFVTETFAGIDSPQDWVFDGLSNRELFTLYPDDETATIQLTPTTEGYRETYELLHDWYEKGYIYKDSATSTDTGVELIRAGRGFAVITGSEIGVEASYEAQCQTDLTCVKLSDRMISTQNGRQFTWVVPNSAESPEAAVAFMSLLYTSPEINNLLAWGIEGRDYIVEDGVAKYPDGNSDVPYHSQDFIIGNQFLVIPWEGSDPDLRQQAAEELAQAEESPYLGFTCDESNITTELSAINNVVEQYRKQINSGVAEPEVLDEYIERLESVGIQKVLDEYQTQLNEWLEQQ